MKEDMKHSDLLAISRRVNDEIEAEQAEINQIGPVPDPSFPRLNEGDLILRYRRPRDFGPMGESELIESLADEDGSFDSLRRIGAKELAERRMKKNRIKLPSNSWNV